MATIIKARAPLRLGLAGGGTDVSPFCDIHGGAVLNATIDRYAYAIIRTLDEPVVRFTAADQERTCTLPLAARYELDGELNLLKAAYNTMIEQYNGGKPIGLELTSFCDAPTGSGLGSSSTVVVAIIKAFCELLNVPMDDYALAHLAFRIERVDCGLQGGRQDQYAATFGGFNFMEFYAEERAVINPLRIKNWILCELEASLVLFYTGVSRESAKIIAEQSTNISGKKTEATDAMHAMKAEAQRMKECILKADFNGLVESMHVGWANKKRSASTVSNPLIDEIYESTCKAGARAGKVSGAGGGGFMWFFAPAEKRMDVIRNLSKFNGVVSNCHFTKHGAQAWKQ